MFWRRGNADRMIRPHIEFGQEIIQEHESSDLLAAPTF
jgi:hypothetical protein